MQTEAHAALLGQHPQSDMLHRLEAELCALNERIAQLGIALHTPLETAADVERVLQHPSAPSVPVERRSGEAAPYQGPDRREAHLWEELRGLLVLRWQLCSRMAANVGAQTTQALMDASHQQLQREGFSHGAPSMALKD